MASLASRPIAPSSFVTAAGLLRLGIHDADLHAGCWLQSWLDSADIRRQLGSGLCDVLERRVQGGMTLRSHWPRPWSASLSQAWGPRWFYTHTRHLSSHRTLVSIVSSRNGRHGQRLRRWPMLLDTALRALPRSTDLLLVPKTTLHDPLREYALRSGMPTITVRLPKTSDKLADWLMRCLEDTESPSSCKPDTVLAISSGLDADKPALERDAVAIGLADRVHALRVRTSGNIERWLHWRLGNPQFPVGTVSVNIEPTDKPPDDSLCSLLSAGAIGSYTSSSLPVHSAPSHEQAVTGSSRFVQQLCYGPVTGTTKNHWSRVWDHFLCHCTRGSSGTLPGESSHAYRHRLWLAGQVPELDPFQTLWQICHEGVLRGSATLNRTDQPTVSFSEVPLPELLARRTFRPHLGRWDWEPFGLLIERRVLEQLGARPVVYGSTATYATLDESSRPFFQPAGKQGSWERECEWRLKGTLSLKDLSPDAIRLFVRSQQQAWQLSRHVPWPVLWIEARSEERT